MERMTFDFCIAGQHCWQVHGADNDLGGDVCEKYGEKGCNNCPLGHIRIFGRKQNIRRAECGGCFKVIIHKIILTK